MVFSRGFNWLDIRVACDSSHLSRRVLKNTIHPLAFLGCLVSLKPQQAISMVLPIQPLSFVIVTVGPGDLTLACSLIIFEETLVFGTVGPFEDPIPVASFSEELSDICP
jgi:hypothetical protein